MTRKVGPGYTYKAFLPLAAVIKHVHPQDGRLPRQHIQLHLTHSDSICIVHGGIRLVHTERVTITHGNQRKTSSQMILILDVNSILAIASVLLNLMMPTVYPFIFVQSAIQNIQLQSHMSIQLYLYVTFNANNHEV